MIIEINMYDVDVYKLLANIIIWHYHNSIYSF